MNASPVPMTHRPRRSRGALARALAGVWLVLHVFMVAVMPVADGLTDHRDAVVAHVEDTDGGDCPSSHADLCNLCHFAHGMRALVARGADLSAPVITQRMQVPHAASVAPADFEFLDGHSSRAPPALG